MEIYPVLKTHCLVPCRLANPAATCSKLAAQKTGAYTMPGLPCSFAVYRFENNEPVNLDNAANIISVQNKAEYLDKEANKYRKVKYVVTVLDRLWNESKPSNVAGTSLND